MKVNLKGIPRELKPLKQWVLWRSESRNGRPTKVPYQLNGKRASVADPETWVTLNDIVEARPQGYSGVGFVFVKGGGWVGIDLDDCRNPITEMIEPWAMHYVTHFGTYAEVSPSGTGVKIWVDGELPNCEGTGKRTKFKDGAIEMYKHGRYFAVTGDRV